MLNYLFGTQAAFEESGTRRAPAERVSRATSPVLRGDRGRKPPCPPRARRLRIVTEVLDGIIRQAKVIGGLSVGESSMVDDMRVIMVKLADRLHNMRTLEHLDEAQRVKIAQGDA